MRSRDKNKQRTIIWILAGVIAILVLFLLYFFIAQPAMNKFVVEKRSEGYNLAMSGILNEVSKNGFVEIPVSEGQSILLVPYVPEN